MAADQSPLEAALHAVRDPELGLTLGDLGLVRSVRRVGAACRSRWRFRWPPGPAPTSWPTRSIGPRSPYRAWRRSTSNSW